MLACFTIAVKERVRGDLASQIKQVQIRDGQIDLLSQESAALQQHHKGTLRDLKEAQNELVVLSKNASQMRNDLQIVCHIRFFFSFLWNM